MESTLRVAVSGIFERGCGLDHVSQAMDDHVRDRPGFRHVLLTVVLQWSHFGAIAAPGPLLPGHCALHQKAARTATGDVDLNAGFRLQHLVIILTRFRGRVKLAGALALRHPRRRLHIPAARAGLVAAPPGGCTPSPGGAPQPRHRIWPAPPRRPRPSARHRRLPRRRRAAQSAGPLRARDAPVADAHRPAVRHRPPVAAPRSGPECALAGRRLARGADPAAAAVGRAC